MDLTTANSIREFQILTLHGPWLWEDINIICEHQRMNNRWAQLNLAHLFMPHNHIHLRSLPFDTAVHNHPSNDVSSKSQIVWKCFDVLKTLYVSSMPPTHNVCLNSLFNHFKFSVDFPNKQLSNIANICRLIKSQGKPLKIISLGF